MQSAKLAKNEQARSARLKRSIALDSASERLFDGLAKQAKETYGTKTSSQVSSSRLLGKQRLWFKAKTAASRALLARESFFI